MQTISRGHQTAGIFPWITWGALVENSLLRGAPPGLVKTLFPDTQCQRFVDLFRYNISIKNIDAFSNIYPFLTTVPLKKDKQKKICEKKKIKTRCLKNQVVSRKAFFAPIKLVQTCMNVRNGSSKKLCYQNALAWYQPLIIIAGVKLNVMKAKTVLLKVQE